LTRKPKRDKRELPPVIITQQGREVFGVFEKYYFKDNKKKCDVYDN